MCPVNPAIAGSVYPNVQDRPGLPRRKAMVDITAARDTRRNHGHTRPTIARAVVTVTCPPRTRRSMPLEAPTWLNSGDTSWQITAATLVGLMSVPGLVVLYGGVMQKRWSINSMMLTFATFSIVLIVWVLWAFKMGFGYAVPRAIALAASSGTSSGTRAPCSSHTQLQHQCEHPADRRRDAVVPEVGARLLPVRVRRDHADPGAGLGARAASTSRRGSRSSRCGSRSSTRSTRS